MGSLHSEIVEDFAEEQYGPLEKRSRLEYAPLTQLDSCNNGSEDPPYLFNPLDEPSPLGLKLRKSPSLLELIRKRLSQDSTASAPASSSEVSDPGEKKDEKVSAASTANDKLKASNFPASLLRIGSWEYVSKYEGDLVAKCYYAKHKIVWEVLEGGLKSKIEIQWSDITALKAQVPENAPGSLAILLGRKPIFFRETNPQPRKHTLWQASTDFTDGQASVNLKHYIVCPPGVLNKHYEKLVQCDMRLYLLSQQPELVVGSPCLESQASVPESSQESKGKRPRWKQSAKEPPVSICLDTASSAVADTQVTENSKMNDEQNSSEQISTESPKAPGLLHTSMSMNDLVNHLESCLSEQMNSGSLPSNKALECQDMLENISQVLLSDTPFTTALDELSLMKKVNSLCSLLQDSSQADGDSIFEISPDCGKSIWNNFTPYGMHQTPDVHFKDSPGINKPVPAAMSRKDSFGDLLFHLPRIASLPKFPKLFGISGNNEFQEA